MKGEREETGVEGRRQGGKGKQGRGEAIFLSRKKQHWGTRTHFVPRSQAPTESEISPAPDSAL